MPDKEILDLTRLEEAYEDDVAGIAELLTMALVTSAKHVAALREGLAAGDMTSVSRAAHSIKGSAANIGAARAASIAAEIETQARAGLPQGLMERAAALDDAYLELRAAVTSYQRQLSPPV